MDYCMQGHVKENEDCATKNNGHVSENNIENQRIE